MLNARSLVGSTPPARPRPARSAPRIASPALLLVLLTGTFSSACGEDVFFRGRDVEGEDAGAGGNRGGSGGGTAGTGGSKDAGADARAGNGGTAGVDARPGGSGGADAMPSGTDAGVDSGTVDAAPVPIDAAGGVSGGQDGGVTVDAPPAPPADAAVPEDAPIVIPPPDAPVILVPTDGPVDGALGVDAPAVVATDAPLATGVDAPLPIFADAGGDGGLDGAVVVAAGDAGLNSDGGLDGATAATSLVLAYEPFTAAATRPLEGLEDGFGWAAPYNVQNGVMEGYLVELAPPLTYPGLLSTPSYATGGQAYLGSGRALDVAQTFASYANGALIGKPGTTLWISALMRLDTADQTDLALSLHASSAAWYQDDGTAPTKIALGSFYPPPANGPEWALRVIDPLPANAVNKRVYSSGVAVTRGVPALLVASIAFTATGGQVKLWVNPTSLGGTAPTVANVTADVTADLGFRSVAFVPGNGAGAGSADEIRIGTSYAAVTPAAP